MNFSTLFRLEENLNLDKKTLVHLRWIAIIGQLIAINLVFFVLNLEFPILLAYGLIFIGLSTNIYLQYSVRNIQLKDFHASLVLIYDLAQLSLLLYLTGGISNPFSILLIVPTIVSSTFLSMGTTIILGFLTITFLFLLNIFHFPLPGIHENAFTFPKYYLTGFLAAIIIGLIFLSYFGARFAGETKKRSEALNKLQEILAKEYELESLGGQAAAAAHSLGTPLATISVVAKELKKEIGNNKDYSKDIELLITQTKRCSEILKKISKKQIKDDEFFNFVILEDLLNEIIDTFKETTSKKIILISENDKNKIRIKRIPEIVYGLRNFIGNAVKFSNDEINIILNSDEKNIDVIINDDGPGFPEDIIDIIGEPYIKSKSQDTSLNSGLGLGTFLGKTLLERQFANLLFSKDNKLGGASVKISWSVNYLKFKN